MNGMYPFGRVSISDKPNPELRNHHTYTIVRKPALGGRFQGVVLLPKKMEVDDAKWALQQHLDRYGSIRDPNQVVANAFARGLTRPPSPAPAKQVKRPQTIFSVPKKLSRPSVPKPKTPPPSTTNNPLAPKRLGGVTRGAKKKP